jgi:hypothetical protein
MQVASEIEPVSPGISLWRFYDSSVKADLFSTALETVSGIYLVDPIPLSPTAIGGMTSRAKIAGIVVTNENHSRAAGQFSDEFEVPIFLDAALEGKTNLPRVRTACTEGFPADLTAIPIEGGPAGEIAIHFAAGDGVMVIGDALINFEPYGFALLPPKYCSNFKLMSRSLAKLLDRSFAQMLFAHGLPILSHARERLERLLKAYR